MTDAETRLTLLAHGGGCGCKLSPAVLRQILERMPVGGIFPDLLVGAETSDDAAVYRLNDSQAIVATTDFFMPIVDDPFDFGRIAATNALSDVYAMGGRPILALAIVGMPVEKVGVERVQRILEGGAAACAAVGVPVAGGHSIDSQEPIYGLVALGIVHPDRVRRNSAARPGDVLILTKALGVGILSAALRREQLSAAGYDAMIASTTQVNAVGAMLAERDGVHAITDVTGFGLLGHALEMCRGAGTGAQLRVDAVPLLPEALALAQGGVRTGASTRNWASYGEAVRLPAGLPDWQRDLLCDPQTSGGLLVAVAREEADATLAMIRDAGFGAAAIVGEVVAGEPAVTVA
ncbi:MAG: selenide, water dikinase SelD [Sphingomonas sp.]